jgi:hypothetical protein
LELDPELLSWANERTSKVVIPGEFSVVISHAQHFAGNSLEFSFLNPFVSLVAEIRCRRTRYRHFESQNGISDFSIEIQNVVSLKLLFHRPTILVRRLYRRETALRDETVPWTIALRT